jgi:hypothetical protein
MWKLASNDCKKSSSNFGFGEVKEMNYEEFTKILNHHIFQSEREDLLRTMANYPERFIGLFRPSKPKGKIFQHFLQAREIKFGDAMEEIIAKWLEHYGYRRLDSRIQINDETMKCDHYVLSPDGSFAVLVEQKVRDDHDSSKARGQWRENFAPKVRALHRKHGENLIAVTYFIDPTFRKNLKLYSEEAEQLKSELNLPQIYIWYGRELFENLPFADPKDWDAMIEWLQEWRRHLPDLPEVNWETEEAIAELQDIARRSPSLWGKLAMQELLWTEGYLSVLFPTGKGLLAVLKALEEQGGKRYQKAANALRNRLR